MSPQSQYSAFSKNSKNDPDADDTASSRYQGGLNLNRFSLESNLIQIANI